MFDSFSSELEPAWREKLLVVALFGIAASIAGAASSILPLVDFRFWHVWQACLSAMAAALPLSRHFVVASRKSAHFKVGALSLVLCALGYVAFMLWLFIIPTRTSFEGSTEASWQLTGFVAYAVVVVTWPVYVPAALLVGYTIASLTRRRLAST